MNFGFLEFYYFYALPRCTFPKWLESIFPSL